MDNKQARYLHRMLDRLAEGKNLSPEEIALLRKELPELPIQKTLEEIAWDIHFAWCETVGNDWKAELFGDLEPWLAEQHTQLRAHLEGVKSQAHSALPAGMRIAEHNTYGRCVVSQKVDDDGDYLAFIACDQCETKCDHQWVDPDDLTFLDSEPGHPEFLETEADYRKAPEGTIVACEDSSPWYKFDSVWLSSAVYESSSSKDMTDIIRRVLRWGWSE